jgi:anthranilate phosphoribosyltransferase
MTDWTRFIKEVGRGARGARDLPEAEAERLFSAMLDGEVGELELGALWIAYRIKGESLQELLGFCRAVASRSLALSAGDASPQSPVPVLLPSYNGARRLPNMTPLLALLLAREGVPVLVHGLEAGYGRVTSSEIFRALGLPPCTDATDVGARMQRGEAAWMPLETLNPGLARLMQARARIGVRSSAHTVSKLLDPFGGRCLRVVPITHPDYLRRMAECLQAQAGKAVLMRGSEGEPYASPKRMPAMLGYAGGQERELVPQGEHEEIEAVLPAGIDAQTTAAWVRQVLEGRQPVPRTLQQQVDCLSAAARAPH